MSRFMKICMFMFVCVPIFVCVCDCVQKRDVCETRCWEKEIQVNSPLSFTKIIPQLVQHIYRIQQCINQKNEYSFSYSNKKIFSPLFSLNQKVLFYHLSADSRLEKGTQGWLNRVTHLPKAAAFQSHGKVGMSQGTQDNSSAAVDTALLGQSWEVLNSTASIQATSSFWTNDSFLE